MNFKEVKDLPLRKAANEPEKDNNGVYRVGAGVKPPQPIHTPDPEYTTSAKNDKLSGKSVFYVEVDETGKVGKIKVLRPLGLGLDESAVTILRTWIFRPAQLNGQPVKVAVNVEMDFRLF